MQYCELHGETTCTGRSADAAFRCVKNQSPIRFVSLCGDKSVCANYAFVYVCTMFLHFVLHLCAFLVSNFYICCFYIREFSTFFYICALFHFFVHFSFLHFSTNQFPNAKRQFANTKTYIRGHPKFVRGHPKKESQGHQTPKVLRLSIGEQHSSGEHPEAHARDEHTILGWEPLW